MRLFCADSYNLIKYIVCGQLVSENGFLHQKRCIGEHVLIIVTEGILNISANGNLYSVSKGQYIILRANELHYGSSESIGKLSYFWVHFTCDLCEYKGTDAPLFLWPECGTFDVNGRVAVLFHQLADIAFEDDLRAMTMCDYSIRLLLLQISRENDPNMQMDTGNIPIAVSSAMEWIYKNYHSSFSVSELAERFGYTADYFSSLYKKSTGSTLTEFVNSVRIRASKALLANFGVSIKEVAYSCGFPDEKYYMRIFKKSEGMTPTEYRKLCGKSYINLE